VGIKRLQLPLQTLSLMSGFAVWVILSSLMPFIKGDIQLTSTQLAWSTAIPVLLGSILRVPIGYWTNRYGARILFFISFIVLLAPVVYLSRADSFADLLVSGLFLGIGGAVFSVGVTSLPKYYPKERHGFVNGIYGIGNLGTAVTTFSAPVLANAFGWRQAVLVYTALLGIFALLNFLLGDRGETRVKTSLTEQVRGVYRSEKLWLLSLFYFITFGSFVAFTVYLPNFLVSYFGLAKVDAGVRTAGFIALATFMRPVGGYLGDKFNPFKILVFVFALLTVAAVILSFAPSIGLYTVGCLTIAVAAGTGNGTIFKLVPLYFTKQAGIANGIISAMGGLGGFFPPLMLTFIHGMTGQYAIGFMALSEVALMSLILVMWLYYHDRVSLSKSIVEQTTQAIMVTDMKGVIQTVNAPFTEVTGYEAGEIVGKTPSVLKSGKQGVEFYERMWRSIASDGAWQGEIWNRRKNGETYRQWLTINTIRNESGEPKYYVAMFSEMSALAQSTN
jgi:MFS transporter, NNP family, nitrate/nitrite transporter